MAARDQDLRQAEERHAGQERRMLAQADRATHKGQGAGRVAKEQQRRAKGEEVMARRLEAELEKVHQAREAARQAEAGLREHLAAQGIELAQVRTRSEALAASVEALRGAASTMKKPRTRKRGG